MIGEVRALTIEIAFDLVRALAAIQRIVEIEIGQRLFSPGSLDAQRTSRDIQCRANLVNRFLQDDTQLQRLSNCSGNAIDRNLAPCLLLQQVRKLGSYADSELQRSSFGH